MSVGHCILYDSEDTQIFSAIPVFSYTKYFQHRMSNELLYAAHKYLNQAFSKHIFVWRVTPVWQEDRALLAHLELVSQDLWYVYFLFGEREAGQKGKIILSASLLEGIYVC